MLLIRIRILNRLKYVTIYSIQFVCWDYDDFFVFID